MEYERAKTLVKHQFGFAPDFDPVNMELLLRRCGYAEAIDYNYPYDFTGKTVAWYTVRSGIWDQYHPWDVEAFIGLDTELLRRMGAEVIFLTPNKKVENIPEGCKQYWVKNKFKGDIKSVAPNYKEYFDYIIKNYTYFFELPKFDALIMMHIPGFAEANLKFYVLLYHCMLKKIPVIFLDQDVNYKMFNLTGNRKHKYINVDSYSKKIDQDLYGAMCKNVLYISPTLQKGLAKLQEFNPNLRMGGANYLKPTSWWMLDAEFDRTIDVFWGCRVLNTPKREKKFREYYKVFPKHYYTVIAGAPEPPYGKTKNHKLDSYPEEFTSQFPSIHWIGWQWAEQMRELYWTSKMMVTFHTTGRDDYGTLTPRFQESFLAGCMVLAPKEDMGWPELFPDYMLYNKNDVVIKVGHAADMKDFQRKEVCNHFSNLIVTNERATGLLQCVANEMKLPRKNKNLL